MAIFPGVEKFAAFAERLNKEIPEKGFLFTSDGDKFFAMIASTGIWTSRFACFWAWRREGGIPKVLSDTPCYAFPVEDKVTFFPEDNAVVGGIILTLEDFNNFEPAAARLKAQVKEARLKVLGE